MLRYHLKKARNNSSSISYIKGNKLYVDGSVDTRLTLQESADTTEKRRILSPTHKMRNENRNQKVISNANNDRQHKK